MKNNMTTSRVTITIPSDLFEWGERERAKEGINRSEFVSELYRRHRDEQLEKERVERYKTAYVEQPSTQEEGDWANAAAAELAKGYQEE